jgi:Mce-associated membrane protein
VTARTVIDDGLHESSDGAAPDKDVPDRSLDTEVDDSAHGDGTDIVDSAGDVDDRENRRTRMRLAPRRWALVAGITMVVTLTGLTAWLGWNAYQTRQMTQQRAQFLQVACQGAVNLTTIDWQHADTDVQRIINSATGKFYDDFSKRTMPFIDVLKQAQSKAEGTITAAALESASATDAQALVAVSVKISDAGAAEQTPRLWRMRIAVHKAGDQIKVADVEFVP